MGKDKVKPPAPAPEPAPAAGKPPKGHRQRGAGTVITAKPAVVTGDGIVLKAHERLPSTLLHEYCQKEKRPMPKYYSNPPGNKFRAVLHDGKNDKNDMTFAPTQSFESASVARDFAALLALFHVQRSLPLERRLPEPYASTWLSMIATEKEQAKADSKNAKAGTATAAAPTAPAAKPAAVEAKAADPTVATESATKVGGKATASANATVVVLNRDIADWLCDSCGNQNFAKLASGVQRVRCFKCQAPKTDTCQLVASTASAVAQSAASTSAAAGTVVSIKSAASLAPVNLLTGKNSVNPVTRAEEERALHEKRAASRRKQLYFDALRRANRPHIVHIPAGLRAKLERLLGITTSGASADGGDSDAVDLEDVLQTYQESGLFPPDLCSISTAEQSAVLKRVSAKLLQQDFAARHVAASMHEVLLQSANDLLDDALEGLESVASPDGKTVAGAFEKLLSEALLKHLCMNVEESQLPDAYNPKFLESNKKLSVVNTTTAAAVVSASTSAASARPAGAVATVKTERSGTSSAPSGASSADPAVRAALADVMRIANASATATAPNLCTEQDCTRAIAAAQTLLSSRAQGVSSSLTLASLLILCEASDSDTLGAIPPGVAALRDHISTVTDGAQPPEPSGHFEPFLEELESLQAIFDDNITHACCAADSALPYHEITLQVSLEHLCAKRGRSSSVFGAVKALTLHVIVHTASSYPQHPPLIFLYPSTAASAAARAAVSALQRELREKAQELLGEGMVFQLHSHLQERVDSAEDIGVTSNGAVQENVRRVCAYLSGDAASFQNTAAALTPEVPIPAGTTASVKTVPKSVQDGDAGSVASTQLSEYSGATTSNTAATAGRNNSRKGERRGPSLQSFWSPLPASAPVPAKTIASPQAAAMAEARRRLPAFEKRSEVLELLASNRAVVVTGETGCGKTTQVPQYLYEQDCTRKILICQPRRLAAVGVATRVAEEVGCALGEQVGYMVKGDSQISAQTRIAFCTYGVLLRRLQADPTLSAVSTVVLDEVHERGIDSDFTLALLMSALARRPDLKLILMSATISTEHFASYLRKWLRVDSVPVMFIPGFTFPVREFYKADYEAVVREFKDFTPAARQQESDFDDAGGDNPYAYQIGGRPRKGDIDYDLLTKLVMVLARGALSESAVSSELQGVFSQAHGSILVFMPGVPEISRLSRLLEAHYKATSSTGATVPKLRIIPLHGNLSPTEQKAVFRDAGRNEIKIVIATNVAEASVTIPDVTVVVDTCRVKEISFDSEIQTSALMMKFAAQDSLRQRRGRAGRVQKGRCFRLITKGTYEKLPEHSVPEILRVPLEKVVLQVKAMIGGANTAGTDHKAGKKADPSASAKGNSSMTLLCRCPDVPTEASVNAAEQLLVQIQALNGETGLLTALGRQLSTLPCMPRVGKLCIYGALMGCTYSASAVAACMTVRSPFISSQDPEMQRRIQNAKDQFSGGSVMKSDYTVLVNALQEFDNSRNKRRFCQDYGLAFERMNEIKDTQGDLLGGLVELGLLGSLQEGLSLAGTGAANRNAGKSRLVSATLCAGLYPQLARILRPTKRFVEVSGGAFERDSLAKELKFYIPRNIASPAASLGASGAIGGVTGAPAGVTALPAKVVDKRNIDISTDDLFRVFLHPSSCNFDNFSFKESNFIMYGERQLVTYPGSTDSKVFLRDTTEASAFALLFFGGQLQADYTEGTVTVDGWIRFTAPGRTVAILEEVRGAFDALLQRKFEDPGLDIAGQPVVDLTCQLLDTNAQY